MTVAPKPLARAKRAILRALRARGIAEVEIVYDGQGDDGQIIHIYAYDAKNRQADLGRPVRLALREGITRVRYRSLAEALDDFAWMVLGHYHDGFENCDGGYGSITINTGRGEVMLDHNDRVIEAVNTRTEV
jgi:hypothetical protein